jgi:hypothetical protein
MADTPLDHTDRQFWTGPARASLSGEQLSSGFAVVWFGSRYGVSR